MTHSPLLIRHESEAGCWDLAVGEPSPALAPWVLRYSGYREHPPHLPVMRREVPFTGVVLIINFGSPFTVCDLREFDREPGAARCSHHSFVAGLYDRPVMVGSDGGSHCLQVDFTPLGACRFFGTSLGELNRTTTSLDDVLGPAAVHWIEQLNDAADWPRCFERLERLLAVRFAGAVQPRAEVERAWQLMLRSRGRIKIHELARHLNQSREHCSRLIRAELGMSPKNLLRVIRFEQAYARLQQGRGRLADVALDCGYADQSHFTAEFKAISGCTPRQLLAIDYGDGGLIERPA